MDYITREEAIDSKIGRGKSYRVDIYNTLGNMIHRDMSLSSAGEFLGMSRIPFLNKLKKSPFLNNYMIVCPHENVRNIHQLYKYMNSPLFIDYEKNLMANMSNVAKNSIVLYKFSGVVYSDKTAAEICIDNYHGDFRRMIKKAANNLCTIGNIIMLPVSINIASFMKYRNIYLYSTLRHLSHLDIQNHIRSYDDVEGVLVDMIDELITYINSVGKDTRKIIELKFTINKSLERINNSGKLIKPLTRDKINEYKKL